MKRNLLLFVATFGLLYGCSQDAAMSDDVIFVTTNTLDEEASTHGDFIQMRQLIGEVLGGEVAASITPTSRHIKFFPKSKEEYYRLLGSPNFKCHAIPLYGIDENSQYSISEDGTKYNVFYAEIEKENKLPDKIQYEVLQEFYDPSSTYSGLTKNQIQLILDAIKEQTTLTRVIDPEESWKPSGGIQIVDELIPLYVPLAYIPVHISGKGIEGNTIQETCYTDIVGRFYAKRSYWGGVNYSIEWITDDYAATDQANNIYTTNGPTNSKAEWRLYISQSNAVYKAACGFRAAMNMQNNGLPLPKYSNYPVCLNFRNESVPAGKDDYFTEYVGVNVPTLVFIYCKDKSPAEIYHTVNREVGKTVLFYTNRTSANYSKINKIIKESWGEFTKLYFADVEYKRLGKLNALHTFSTATGVNAADPDDLNKQTWCYTAGFPNTSMLYVRTPLFIDMYDDYEQTKWPGLRHSELLIYPNDKVSFTFDEIKNWAMTSKSLAEMKTKIQQNMSSGSTKYLQVNNLFTVYLKAEASSK